MESVLPAGAAELLGRARRVVVFLRHQPARTHGPDSPDPGRGAWEFAG
ncbi:hypothetical protein AB0J90_17995 [Micromonospora sp. NPDC049523]